MTPFIYITHDFLLICHCMCRSILYHFRAIWRWRMSWPWGVNQV